MKTWPITTILVILSGLSLVVLRSIAPQLVGLQVLFFLLAFVVLFVTSRIPFEWWLQISPLLYVAEVVLLVLPLISGAVTRGSSRWIPIFGLHVQPSQLAVPVVALFAAEWMRRHPVDSIPRLAQFLVLLGVPAGLIAIEPDLGTTVLFMLSLGVMVWLSELPSKLLFGSLGLAVVALGISWLLLLQPYQKQRVLSFLSPESDLSGAGYNARQSLIAVGSGRLIGRGLGQGVQSHLRFLPERQTDFIFASLAEELGFIGSVAVLGMYGLLFWLMIQPVWYGQSRTELLFVSSIVVLLVVQTTVHVGMNMGIFPITGITLPFISYGGSSILSLALGVGLVQSALQNVKYTETLSIS